MSFVELHLYANLKKNASVPWANLFDPLNLLDYMWVKIAT